jgi:hypothetical protein
LATSCAGFHAHVTRRTYGARMELDELFSPDDTDVPRSPDTDDAFEL